VLDAVPPAIDVDVRDHLHLVELGGELDRLLAVRAHGEVPRLDATDDGTADGGHSGRRRGGIRHGTSIGTQCRCP
jgi:hypothetical protein